MMLCTLIFIGHLARNMLRCFSIAIVHWLVRSMCLRILMCNAVSTCSYLPVLFLSLILLCQVLLSVPFLVYGVSFLFFVFRCFLYLYWFIVKLLLRCLHARLYYRPIACLLLQTQSRKCNIILRFPCTSMAHLADIPFYSVDGDELFDLITLHQ